MSHVFFRFLLKITTLRKRNYFIIFFKIKKLKSCVIPKYIVVNTIFCLDITSCRVFKKRMNNHTKNQHYVPQFLLKNFSSKGGKFIWAFDRKEKYNIQNQIKERAIKRVASEEYFYDQFKNSEIGSYEYILQKAEDISAPIIEKIIKTKNIENLTQEERMNLSFFIVLQKLRTKLLGICFVQSL